MYRLRRFNKKSPVSHKPPYLTFNPHSVQPCIASSDGLIYITTIDPGIVNCCIRCSAFNPQTMHSKTLSQCLINFTDSGFNMYHDSIFHLLDRFIPYFINSHYIGIESQLTVNTDLVRMAQHIITYLMCVVRNKGNKPLILELDSHLKTRLLGAPKKMNKPQRKKWARDIGIQFLESSGEQNVADIVRSGKGDDHGDTICYEKVIIMILYGRLNHIPFPTQ